MELGERHSAGVRGWDACARAEWASIQRESDPQLYYEDVLAFAARQEAADRSEAALEVYARLIDDAAVPAWAADRARGRRDAILGRGAAGPRAEFLLRRLAGAASEPSALFAMGLAGAAFRVTRLAVLSRLGAAPATGAWTRGWGARAVAGLAGFAVEAPTFTMAGRLAGEALGRTQDWGPEALSRDLASSFLVLGGLKLAGWGFGAAHRGIGARRAAGHGRTGLPLAWSQQGGMLTGILLGHRLEEWAGLRRPVDGATTLVDSLAMLLQFHVAGRLSRAAFGRRFQAWERGLDQQGEWLLRVPPRGGSFLAPPGLRPAWAGVAAMSARLPTNGPSAESGGILMISQGDRPLAEGVAATGTRSVSAPPPHPEAPIRYPPEIDALLAEAEAAMRRPDYYEGDRAALLAKRPPLSVIDRIWFHQAQDLLGRLDYVQTRMGGVELLLQPLPGLTREPDAGLLARAVAALRTDPAGAPSVSSQILEIRFPRAKLTEYFLDPGRSLEGSVATLSSLIEAQQRLGDRVHLATLEGAEFVGRIPSVSLWEKLLQEAFGSDRAQIHPVEGAIPRDRVMALRGQRVSPMGFFRHQLILGDIGEWIYPFGFALHDGFFHAAIDAASRPGYLEFSKRMYDWIEARLAGRGHAQSWLDRLSDGEMVIAHNALGGTLGLELRRALAEGEAASRGALSDAGSARRRAEILGLAEEMLALMRAEAAEAAPSEPAAETLRDWAAFVERLRDQEPAAAPRPRVEIVAGPAAPERSVSAPYFKVPPEIESIFGRMEARFRDPAYFRGERSELLARRPSWNDVDRLWHFQGEDYARRIPGARYEYVDAEVLRGLTPFFDEAQGSSPLPEALRILGERGEAGHSARRVLRIHIPQSFLQGEAYSPSQGPLRYLSVIPPLLEVEAHLNKRMGLMSQADDGAYFHFPSLSLLEAIYRSVHGNDSVGLFPVPGEISRDATAWLRSRRLPPVGFSRGLIYLADAEVEVHPFSFAGHDAVFHAGRDASLADPLPAVAGRFYGRLAPRLPSHPVSETILNQLADLQFDPRDQSLHRRFHGLFTRSLQGAARDAERLPTAEERRAALRGLGPVAAVLRDLVVEEYRHHPGLAGKERSLLAALRRHARPL